jgi:hypothetical protein
MNPPPALSLASLYWARNRLKAIGEMRESMICVEKHAHRVARSQPGGGPSSRGCFAIARLRDS